MCPSPGPVYPLHSWVILFDDEEQGIPHVESGLIDFGPEVVEPPTEGIPQPRTQPRHGTFVRRQHAGIHQLLRQGVEGPAARHQEALRARSCPSCAQTAAEDKANPQPDEQGRDGVAGG